MRNTIVGVLIFCIICAVSNAIFMFTSPHYAMLHLVCFIVNMICIFINLNTLDRISE